MNYPRRAVSVVVFVSLVLISTAVTAADSRVYNVTSGKETLTFIPRPDLGFVTGSKEQTSAAQAFGGILSSAETDNIKKIGGRNNRKFSVLAGGMSDDLKTNAMELLQSNKTAGYTAPLFSVNGKTVAVIPEIVVRLAIENAQQKLQKYCESNGLTLKQKMDFTQKEYLLEVDASDAEPVFDAVKKLSGEPFIEWASLNTASKLDFFELDSEEDSNDSPVLPNDEYFSRLWHLNNTGQTNGTAHSDINALNAWKITSGDPNITIAIIDTGIDTRHPDLAKNLVPGYDFFEDDNDPMPYMEDALAAHGTMCAGLAAAKGNNNIGVCGVAYNCKIMPIRIADSENFITEADIATAFRWAAEHGADVLSNSWGDYYSSQIIYSGIRDVTKLNGIGRQGKGCIVCCAAGNWLTGGPVAYPAAFSEVLAVGATDHNDVVWYYSASGPELDIVAPSGGTRLDYLWNGQALLWTTDILGKYGESVNNLDYNMLDYSDSMSGTSGSTPIVAGVAALVLSVDPNLTNMEVKRILLDSALDLGESGNDDYYGYGRVDANAAVTLAMNPPSTPPTSLITLFVDDNAPGDPLAGNPDLSDPNEDGTSLHPFDSIQKAVDFAQSSETIIVLPGTYTGNGNFDIDFNGKPLKIRSENGPETCIIDCRESGRGFSLHNGESNETKIEGFTIKNGMAYEGAGIYCSEGSSPEITNCIISECWAYTWGVIDGSGGGIYIGFGCSPALKDCKFINNKASLYGGGICNLEGAPTMENCMISGNKAGGAAGGMYNLYSQPTLVNCTFSENSAAYGGGFYNDEGFPALTNCTFNKNTAIDYDGGGFYNLYGVPSLQSCSFIENSAGKWGGAFCDELSLGTMFINCIFYGNTAVSEGGALFEEEGMALIYNCSFASNNAFYGSSIACDSEYSLWGTTLMISNCIIWDGTDSIYNNDFSTLDISYSNIMRSGNSTWIGTGNINKDPLFADRANGDLHLKSKDGRWEPLSQTWINDEVTSPCIDAGDPASEFSNEPQPNGDRINMGAYGNTPEASKSNQPG